MVVFSFIHTPSLFGNVIGSKEMKDIFSARYRKAFFEILNSFMESIGETFPSLSSSQEWKGYLSPKEEEEEEVIREWIREMNTPLKKGCARYSKAVESILGSPTCIYHCVAYRDLSALHASSSLFRSLEGMEDKLDAEGLDVFWQYMTELNDNAYRSVRSPPSRVPTPEEISSDIAKRKRSPSSNAPMLKQGVLDVWDRLCDLRGVKREEGEELGKKLYSLSCSEEGKDLVDLLKRRDPSSFGILLSSFSYLGDEDPTEEQFLVAEKAVSLSTMEGSIPAPMMKGIEEVANELSADILSGRANLSNLDVEAIGKRVLTNISPEEMSIFANNIEKLIPAISNL